MTFFSPKEGSVSVFGGFSAPSVCGDKVTNMISILLGLPCLNLKNSLLGHVMVSTVISFSVLGLSVAFLVFLLESRGTVSIGCKLNILVTITIVVIVVIVSILKIA